MEGERCCGGGALNRMVVEAADCWRIAGGWRRRREIKVAEEGRCGGGRGKLA